MGHWVAKFGIPIKCRQKYVQQIARQLFIQLYQTITKENTAIDCQVYFAKLGAANSRGKSTFRY